ncbi:MAG: hypothetical protein RMK74_03575 [Myxococcales bacterium]|nr:hypothetical protein [Myxococcales bacterium]
MSELRSGLAVRLAWLWILASCGEDRPPRVPPADASVDRVAPTDAPRPDRDGPSPEGGPMDGDLDDGGGIPTCRFDPAADVWTLGADPGGFPQRPGLAAVDDGALLALVRPAEMPGVVATARLHPTAAPSALRNISGSTGGTGSAALVRTASASVLATWIDNAPGRYELHSRTLDVTGAPTATPIVLTDSPAREDAPALAWSGSGGLVAWVEADAAAQRIRTMTLGAGGRPRAASTVVTGDGDQPTLPVLVAAADGYLLGWVEASSDAQHVLLARLDGRGHIVGAPRPIESEGVPAGTIDIAVGDGAGLAVFDVAIDATRGEVRARPIDLNGVPTGAEVTLTPGELTGRGPGITAFSGGYAVVFRASDAMGHRIRLVLVDAIGTVVQAMDLASATPEGGAARVVVSGRGDLFVAWTDATGVGATEVRAARVRCSGRLPGPPDGGVDGGTMDGGSGTIDAGTLEGGSFDAASCLVDGAFDPCACPAMRTCAVAADCPGGTICASDGCGERRCIPAGHGCSTDADCPSGSRCVSGPDGRVCQRTSGGCADSRDCPPGFSCDSGRCVDRRMECTERECPLGFYCERRIDLGQAFCRRVHRPCATDAACEVAGRCVDVTGEGRRQCQLLGPCATHADCPAGQLCGSYSEVVSMCGPYGPCARTSDCPTGHECLDTWGDGLGECVRMGGTCRRTADCPEHHVCGAWSLGEPPSCIGGGWRP